MQYEYFNCKLNKLVLLEFFTISTKFKIRKRRGDGDGDQYSEVYGVERGRDSRRWLGETFLMAKQFNYI